MTDNHPVYYILNGSEEKYGQIEPEVLRFRNRAHLKRWLAKGGEKALKDWEQIQGDLFGGWPTVILVSYLTSQNADFWLEQKEMIEGLE